MSDHHTPSGNREVALIGADTRWAKLVRHHLYQYTHRMPDIRIYDLGDLRRQDPDFVIGPLIELLSSQICPLLIGTNLGVMNAVRQGLMQMRNTFRPVVIHESIPESLITHDKPLVIGVQQHLIPKHIPRHVHAMHLSDARNAMSEAETMIRDSNGLVFDLTAMSVVDMPAQKSSSSSGFCTEEACMLMRFAGLHADTRAVMITGHDPMSLQLDTSANTTAQLIWYFLEAFNQCIVEDPLGSPHYTSYSVHLEQYDTGFKFYKSERTGRWWVQLLSGIREPVFPCTYRDYQSATNGLVSDRLISCTNASLESSKQTF
ncbi:MAG TPA: hypothetical protein VI603_01725 [Saprospiraceae bacterium]|nr:hypothetical protein [Saprospiraceae bacterium]